MCLNWTRPDPFTALCSRVDCDMRQVNVRPDNDLPFLYSVSAKTSGGETVRMTQDHQPYQDVKEFPYISSELPEGMVVRTSEWGISGAEIFCLFLFLLLFLYSCFIFFTTWKKNYRMPEGVFYFEEKTVESTDKDKSES